MVDPTKMCRAHLLADHSGWGLRRKDNSCSSPAEYVLSQAPTGELVSGLLRDSTSAYCIIHGKM